MRLPGSSMHPVHPASVQILYRFTSPQFLQIKWSPSSKDLRTNEIRITFYIILSLVIFRPLLQNHHQTLTPKISRKNAQSIAHPFCDPYEKALMIWDPRDTQDSPRNMVRIRGQLGFGFFQVRLHGSDVMAHRGKNLIHLVFGVYPRSYK